jgi:arylsulfatase A
MSTITTRWLGLAIVLLPTMASARDASPNIVYIISDDQSYRDFGFMGNDRVHTPHIDALAARSARFVNGYVPSSVCRPSLATLLTGLYPHQHGVTFNHGPPGNAAYNQMTSREEYERIRSREFELIGRVETLPAVLVRQRGYRALQTGKFWEGHWRNGGFTEGMTTFEPPPGQTFGGVRQLANGESVAHGNGDAGLRIGRETMRPILDFIDDCSAAGTPWMVWYAPYLPHQPHDSPQRFYDMAGSRPNVPAHELPYFAAIAQLDDTVGELVRHVDAKRLTDRTIFVLVSDNGWRASENSEKSRPVEFAQTKNSKRAPFEDGVRTPLLIRWDGVTQPATHQGLVHSIDLMPTLLRAAGAGESLIGSLPGIDLMPAASGRTSLDPERTVFGELYPGDATTLDNPAADIAYRWARQGDFKLIVPHLHDGEKQPWARYLPDGKPVLFNVRIDPAEARNVIAAHPEIAADLQAQLDAWWDPLRVAEANAEQLR